MSNPNKMINDPYAVEIQLQQMINERKLWFTGKKYKDLNKEDFTTKMKDKFIYLYNASPLLFDKICSGFLDNNQNLAMITKMLSLSKDIYDGKKEQNDVDKGLGQVLADKYVKPIVDKLDKK